MSSYQKRLAGICQSRRRVTLLLLALLSALMLGVGIYFKQYFVVFAFVIWLSAESLLLRLQTLISRTRPQKAIFKSKNSVSNERDRLWELYQEATDNSYTLSGLKLSEWLGRSPTEDQKKWSVQFRALSHLKLLIDSTEELTGKKAIQQAFAFNAKLATLQGHREHRFLQINSRDQIVEAAVTVSDLLTQTQKIAEQETGLLGMEARKLLEKLLAFPFEPVKTRTFVDRIVDSIQKDSGCAFLALNLIRNGWYSVARDFGKTLLSGEIDCDEDLKSTLYWVAEIHWFSKSKKQEILNHDEAIKLLYHLCFVDPNRAGFLEIDSQFFSEFGPINEIAEEGFLFKDSLVEAILDLWEDYDGWFDGVFQSVLEELTGRKSKIFDERQNWLRFWRSEKEQFSREYLYVVEGNLTFASGHLEDAKFCYKKALELAPELRSAIFNLLYLGARTKEVALQQWAVKKILEKEEWLPLGLSAIGNSYLLLGDEKTALEYYERLRKCEGWEKKIEYYMSLFCFENGLTEKALHFAKIAHELNPLDSSINFHFSRCLSSVGNKEAALEAVKRVRVVGETGAVSSETPSWLSYYKFTLERDSGRIEEASQTLLKIPSEYFDDEDELAAAIDFAKSKKDLNLLRHLKPLAK